MNNMRFYLFFNLDFYGDTLVATEYVERQDWAMYAAAFLRMELSNNYLGSI